MTTLDQQLFELMIKAPAVPDWFRPDMAGIYEPSTDQFIDAELLWAPAPPERLAQWRESKRVVGTYNTEKAKRKILQWPSAYARMVMEAAGKP